MKKTKHPLEAIFFPVRKVAAHEYLPDMEFDNPISNFIIAETPEGISRVINTCSPDYELFTNREVFSPIYEEMRGSYDIDTKATNFGYNRVKVEFIIKDRSRPFDRGTLFPKVTIYNSYDSSVRYKVFMEIFRLECKNGLCTPLEDMDKYSRNLLHTSGSRQEVEQISEITEKFLGDFNKIVDGYKPLQKAKLNKQGAVDRINEIRESIEFPKAALELAMSRLDYEIDTLKMPINDFLVYNAMNYGIYNSDLALRDHKKQKVDKEVLSFLLP